LITSILLNRAKTVGKITARNSKERRAIALLKAIREHVELFNIKNMIVEFSPGSSKGFEKRTHSAGKAFNSMVPPQPSEALSGHRIQRAICRIAMKDWIRFGSVVKVPES
jgi:hypothetical protein